MKVFANVLLLSAALTPVLGLAIPVVKRTETRKSGSGDVNQGANSGNLVWSHGNGGKASNGDTKAKSGKSGWAIAMPWAQAEGGDTTVSSGNADNFNENSSGKKSSGDVNQGANSGNAVDSSNNGGKASNGDTTAKSGSKSGSRKSNKNSGSNGGYAIAVPIAQAGGGDTQVSSGDASNTNSNSKRGRYHHEEEEDCEEEEHNHKKSGDVNQGANSGNWVSSSNNGGKASNGNTKAKSGRKGYAIAIPIAKADGGDTIVSSGDASNSNSVEKRGDSWGRNHGGKKQKQGDVNQGANSGNVVNSSGNGGKASNGDTSSDGLIAVAVPVAVAGGGLTDVKSGNAKNSNSRDGGRGSSGDVNQGANSGNAVNSHNNGGKAKNGDTSAGGGKNGGLVAVAVPIAVAGGGNTNVESGDASNSNESS